MIKVRYIVMNIETHFQSSIGIPLDVSEKNGEGIIGFIPVFKNKTCAKKYAKSKDNAGEIIAVTEKGGQSE